MWSNAYQQLSSVSPGAQVHGSVLDFYLANELYTMALKVDSSGLPAFYLHQTVIREILSDSLKHTLRRQLLLPEDGKIKKCPILFLQGYQNTDCHDGPNILVLLDYTANKVFLFGCFGRRHDDTMYITWSQTKLWRCIANGFGWVVEDEGPSAFQLDWIQVSRSLTRCLHLYST
jgi:hypothetical protein